MKKLILTLCLAATGTFAAVAQMRLTLDQALDLALSENPTVKVAEMEVQRYDYVKRQTWRGCAGFTMSSAEASRAKRPTAARTTMEETAHEGFGA